MNSITFLMAFLQPIYQLTETKSIQFYENIDEYSHRKLTCSYSIDKSDSIDSVSMFASKLTNDTFQQITLFKPNKSAVLTSNGQYLSNRVTLTNTTELSKEAYITFRNFSCEDERKYYCRIFLTGSGYVQSEMKSNVHNLVVKVLPDKPNRIISVKSQIVLEGESVTLTCEGDVGKPPGKYLWQKILNNNDTFFYKNIETAVTEVFYPDSCGTYNGTSNLTIEVTAEDNQAIFRCVEESLNGSEQMFERSLPLNVYYKVRKTRITKHPNKDFYVVGSEPITLVCNADGNPPSTYAWYKDNNMTEILSNESVLVISTVNITSNGTYLCVAANEFNDNVHLQTQTIEIYINIPIDSTQYSVFWIVTVVAVFLVAAVTVIWILFCRKRKQDSPLQIEDINMHYESTGAPTVHIYADIDNITNNNLYNEIQE